MEHCFLFPQGKEENMDDLFLQMATMIDTI